jgi:hypothetical protein
VRRTRPARRLSADPGRRACRRVGRCAWRRDRQQQRLRLVVRSEHQLEQRHFGLELRSQLRLVGIVRFVGSVGVLRGIRVVGSHELLGRFGFEQRHVIGEQLGIE